MESAGIPDNNSAAARKTKVIHSTIRRIRNQEIATTVDTIELLAKGFGVEAWELLADGAATRERAMKKLMWGSSRHDPSAESDDVQGGDTPKPKKALGAEPSPPENL